MSQLLRKKERLIAKNEEIFETWTDIKTVVSKYIRKVDYLIQSVLGETDSVEFFQSYPKVCSHVDKILNIFLQVQCEFEILSCDEILNFDLCNLHCESQQETSPVVKIGSPSEIEERTRQSPVLDLSVTQVSNGGQDHCDSTVDMCTSAERNCTPLLVNVCETREPIVDHVPILETLPVSVTSEELKTNCNLRSAKKRITHCNIEPNDVLEMVYSHGDSPWNFWLCYYPSADKELILESVGRMFYTNRLEALSTLPDIGDHVLVADGERFLRGQVLTVRGTDVLDNTCVLLLDLDSGRMKSFKLRHIWKIPEEFMSIEAQAVNCQLQGIVGDSSNWCKENVRKCNMAYKFEALLLQTTLSVKFIGALSDSSLSRYIIDADCIDLETDRIYNVSQLVNDTIIPALLFKSEDEGSENGKTLVLQKSLSAVSLNSEIKNTVPNTTKRQANDEDISVSVATSVLCECDANCMTDVTRIQSCEVHENSADTISQELCGSSSDCLPRIQRATSCEVSIDLISQRAHKSDADYVEIVSLCGTPYSDDVLVSEETLENITAEDVEEAADVTGIEVLSTENVEGSANVIESIYCNRDIILKRRSYSPLLNQLVLGYLSFLDSPSLFYVQFFLEDSNDFHKEMGNFYSENKIKFSTKEAAQNIINSYCVALYPQDRQWYRAEIRDWMPSSETSVCVHFVDFGDTMNVELDSIQPLAKEFATLPILAQKCHLHGVAPVECAMDSYVSYEWSTCSLSVFRTVFDLDNLYNMQVMEVTSYGSVGVLLVDPECPETSINKKLISLGHAKYLLSEENLSLWDPMKDEYERYVQYSYNDEDACEAVTGYSPNDEQRFCKFYARYGKCFKGSNCRKEHVASHPDGWISDKEEVFQNAFSQIVLPEVGETVYLQVTCVIRINLFYVIFNIDDNSEEETLLTLNRYINEKENLKSLRKLDVTPAIGQLVLAHYDQDGIWYRARVIDTDNDNNLVQVFFVDYGNTEWVSEMYVRDIAPQYLHLPFQAIESSLAFVEMNESVDDDSLETVISKFRSLTNCTLPLKANIISKDTILKKLELQLYDVNGHDIALTLANTGYVGITRVQLTPATAFALPG